MDSQYYKDRALNYLKAAEFYTGWTKQRYLELSRECLLIAHKLESEGK